MIKFSQEWTLVQVTASKEDEDLFRQMTEEQEAREESEELQGTPEPAPGEEPAPEIARWTLNDGSVAAACHDVENAEVLFARIDNEGRRMSGVVSVSDVRRRLHPDSLLAVVRTRAGTGVYEVPTTDRQISIVSDLYDEIMQVLERGLATSEPGPAIEGAAART